MSLIALSLERCKAAPLQLELAMRHVGEGFKFRDLIAPYIQNIETLWFTELVKIEDFARTLPNFPQSTPNLRSLELFTEDDTPEWDPSIDPFTLFPDTLRSLKLTDIPLYPSFLKLRTLTNLSFRHYAARFPLDTLLDLLEENRSLETVDLIITSDAFPAQIPQRRVVVLNQLQRLSIMCWDPMIARILITNIPLRRGVRLGINLHEEQSNFTLNGILSGIPMSHLSNLSSLTSMEHRSSPPVIRLAGPNGTLSYTSDRTPGFPGEEFPTLPLADVKELCLVYDSSSFRVPHPSIFPALEALTIECVAIDLSQIFLTLFPNPSFFPSLKTFVFLDCDTNESFMEELIRFACGRKCTASAWLQRIVIIHRTGKFPSADSVRGLGEHVPVVDVRFDRTSPTDLV